MTDSGPLDRAVLRTIVEGATTLQEYLGRLAESTQPATSIEHADSLLERWRNALSAEGREVCLERRLSWSALDHHDVSRLFAAINSRDAHGHGLAEPGPLPSWAETLGAIAARTQDCFRLEGLPESRHEHSSPAFVAQSDPLPFEELLVPAVQFATHELLERLVRHVPSTRLGPSAFHDLQHLLLVELTKVSEKTLFHEFSRTRSYGRNLVLSVREAPPAPSPRQNYQAFVTRHGKQGLSDLLHTYPVWGRLLATLVESWVDATAEFIRRLERDWSGLCGFVSLNGDADSIRQVASIRTGVADRHQGGRAVLILTFQDGRRVVYKPRDLRLHRAFHEFLEWCTANAAVTLRCPRVLLGQGYGWLEHIEPAPVADLHEARRFYRQAGELLCTVHLLSGTDCHFENLIARGSELLLVDTETLFHSNLRDDETGIDSAVDSTSRVWESVLQTGFLPSWEFSIDRSVAVDLSGLGSGQLPQELQRHWRWSAMNTDDMHRRVAAREPLSLDNVPVIDKLHVDPTAFVGELTEGFESAYWALMLHRDRLLAERGPLEAFRGLTARFVFRPTKVYAAVLERCLEPEVLRNGVGWGLELEVLARAFVTLNARPTWWPLFEAEIGDLVRFDVPYFVASTTDTLLRLPYDEKLDVLNRAAWSTVQARINAMSPGDLSFQTEIIRGAYAARASGTPRHVTDGPTTDIDLDAPPLTDAMCVEEAGTLAEELTRRALRDEQGVLHWLGFAYVPEAGRLQFDLAPQGLYDGRCGVALFLAALDCVEGGDRHAPVWKLALEPFRKLLAGDLGVQREFARSGLGLATGFGGIVYTFVRLANLAPAAEQAWLMDVASHAACCVTKPLAEQDELLDLLGGGAGAVIGLLALHRMTGDVATLERAIGCGRRVALEYRDRLTAARSSRRPLLTGFSHGASGVAFALMTLFDRTGERLFKQVAHQALDYEADVFDTERANWPDYRFDVSRPDFQTSWCHGAPGIGLARLGILASGPDTILESQWAKAIETTRQAGLLTTDNLCCGSLGLADVLLTSGRYRHRDDLCASAKSLASRVLHRARSRSGFRFFAGESRVFNPGLFQGAAGVGYQLLRLARPDLVSSVLLFESTPAVELG